MAWNTPAGLFTIGSLSSHVNREVNLMGVVTDFQPAARSRGTDWMCNFRLADSTIFDDGIKVRFFRPLEMELPKIQSNGDVVILEKVKITSWSGMVMGLSTLATTWVVFPAVSIPEKAPSGALNLKYLQVKGCSPSQEQMRYAIELCNSRERGPYDASAPISISTSTPSSTALTATTTSTPTVGRRDKFALVKDVQVDNFYDLVGQVVKVYPGNGVVELYMTDYTSNKELFNYEWGRDDPDAAGNEDDSLLYGSSPSTKRKWPGPFGKYTLIVGLFPPHSYHAQNHVKEGQFVFLRNVRIKWSKDMKMEGSLHTDRRNPDRVDVTVIHDHEDGRVKDVLRRKLQYGKNFKRQQEAFIQQNNNAADNQGEALAELTRGQKRKQAEQPKLSKAEKRRQKKKKHDEQLKKKFEDIKDLNSSADEGQKENTDPNTDPYRVRITHKPPKPAQHNRDSTPSNPPPPSQPPSKPSNLNKNIRTSKPTLPTRPLASILSLSTHTLTTPQGTPYTLPFQNLKSRALVRIVDFFPPNIADFAVRKRKESEFDVLSDCSGDCSSSEGEDRRRRLPDDTDTEEENDAATSQRAGDDSNASHTPKWEWRFALILEDASSSSSSFSSSKPTSTTTPPTNQLTAYITNEDAVFLLKLDACNLRRKSAALAALREKLFLLWGDLEERKGRDAGEEVERKGRDATEEEVERKERDATQEVERKDRDAIEQAGEKRVEPRSVPFECCIKEYGVRSRRRRAREGAGDQDPGSSGERDEGQGGQGGGGGGRGGEENWGWERKFAMFGTTIL